MKRIAVIPGDGIGIDVTRESMRVLRRVNEIFGARLEFVEFDWGAEKYLKEGIALPPGAFEMFRRDFDAILFGAIGDPRIPDQRHAAEILLALRFGLDLYANVRPVRLIDGARTSTPAAFSRKALRMKWRPKWRSTRVRVWTGSSSTRSSMRAGTGKRRSA